MFYVKVAGVKYLGKSIPLLIENVKQSHPDVDADFLAKIAKTTITTDVMEFVKRYTSTPKPRRKKVSWKDGLTGANALIMNTSGFGVSQLELNRRAGICSNCPMISEFTDCMACGAAAKINNAVEKMKSMLKMGGKIYPNGLKDKSCGHCGCALSVMMATKTSNFSVSHEGVSETRPKECWLNPKSNNFIEDEK
jgi:hypothetical protein